MKFLVDESVGNKLANLLGSAAYDTLFVGDVMPEVDDEKIMAFAESENRVLITADKDFGELAFKLKFRINGVIFFRTLTRNPEKQFEMIRDILDKAEGKFIVVKEGQIRIRSLK
ncbi:DUF5615 family PIN-like protein [Candidatus Woesearchaeota archaeon]|nr:DUF5615 family PIN-like protein [Candidatus Woesearchaeota archaeon]